MNSYDRLLPCSVAGTGQVWVHSRCLAGCAVGRKAEAVAALSAMGIASPADSADKFGLRQKRMVVDADPVALTRKHATA